MKNKTLTVTSTVEKKLVDTMGGFKTTKPLKTANSTIFDLENGTVTYTFSYEPGKDKASFGPLKTPFLP